ncbi:MAG TPA: NUDIX domain-containing protein [Ktedonobacterales bacterium]|jgi:ADP-ribose diphosphatase
MSSESESDADEVVRLDPWLALRRSKETREVYIESSGDEVLVVALASGLASADEVLLSREPSAAFGGSTILLPGGEIEPGEDQKVAANRELQEELGWAASQLDFLGEVRPWSKYLNARSYIYLARGLTESRLPGDEQYAIEPVRILLSEVDALIRNRTLLDARVIAGLFLARAFLDRERGE